MPLLPLYDFFLNLLVSFDFIYLPRKPPYPFNFDFWGNFDSLNKVAVYFLSYSLCANLDYVQLVTPNEYIFSLCANSILPLCHCSEAMHDSNYE